MFHGGVYCGIQNPQFWFDAAEKTGTSGANLLTWGDKSFYLRNTAASAAPNYVPPTLHSGIINGLPAVRFTQTASNTDLQMMVSGNTVFPGAFGTSATGRAYPRQVFAVILPNDNTIGSVVTFRQSTRVFGCDMWFTGGAQFVYDDGIAVSIQASAVVDYTATPILIGWQNDTSNLHCYVNGVVRSQISSLIVSEDGTGNGFTLGRKSTDITTLIDYYLAETLCFFGNESSTWDEQTDRLMTKYAL